MRAMKIRLGPAVKKRKLSMRQCRLWGLGRSPHMRAELGNHKSVRGCATKIRPEISNCAATPGFILQVPYC